MDIASLGGFALGIVMVLFGIISSGGTAAIGNFIDIPSVIITIGGSITGTMACFKMPDFINGIKSLKLSLKDPKYDVGEVIGNIIQLSNQIQMALSHDTDVLSDLILKLQLYATHSCLQLIRSRFEFVHALLEFVHALLESVHVFLESVQPFLDPVQCLEFFQN